MDKSKIDVPGTVNMAIGFLKGYPCAICQFEKLCGIKYKGTCPVWKELKVRLHNVEKMEA